MNTAKLGEKSKGEMEAATGAIASGKNGRKKDRGTKKQALESVLNN